MFFYLLLILMLTLGVVTSYTDIMTRKIRNKHIIMFSTLTMLLLFIGYMFGFLPTGIDFGFIMANIGMAFVLSTLFWGIGFWTAADAKLYTIFSFLISLISVFGSFPNDYPFFSLIICTFLPFFLYFGLVSILKTKRMVLKDHLIKSFHLKVLSNLLVVLFVLGWPLQFLPRFLSNELVFFVFLFFFYYVLDKMKINNTIFFVIFAIARMFFDKSVWSTSFWIIFVIMLVAISLLRNVFFELGFEKFTKSTPINKLKKGMVPAEVIYKKKNKFVTKDIPFFAFSLYSVPKGSLLFIPKPEGFSEEDVKRIKKTKQFLDFKMLKTYQTLPFAPFLFFGVLLVLVVGMYYGNIFL